MYEIIWSPPEEKSHTIYFHYVLHSVYAYKCRYVSTKQTLVVFSVIMPHDMTPRYRVVHHDTVVASTVLHHIPNIPGLRSSYSEIHSGKWHLKQSELTIIPMYFIIQCTCTQFPMTSYDRSLRISTFWASMDYAKQICFPSFSSANNYIQNHDSITAVITSYLWKLQQSITFPFSCQILIVMILHRISVQLFVTGINAPL
jgi:hypothetical protein